MIVIINYGMGNLASIQNMFKKVGADAIISSSLTDIQSADKLILPGVGAFNTGMQKLKESGLQEIIKKRAIEGGIPTLGICLGMQLLMNKSEEGQLPGLGWLDGEVIRFKFTAAQNQIKIPHMGWNTIVKIKDHPLMAGLPIEPRFYFVHSFHVECKNEQDVLAKTNYGYDFASIVAQNNILGTQFHPEKSHKFGMQILRNFAENF
jgi:glutamine amidotransferase